MRQIDAVICSPNDEKFEYVIDGLQPLVDAGLQRVIRIPDAASMGEGYNRGAELASSEWILFCHDDISIQSIQYETFARALNDSDVVGVCGTTRLFGANWYNADSSQLWGSVFAPCVTGEAPYEHQIFGVGRPIVSGAQALDGIFILVRRDTWCETRFDETIPGFTLYDIDFTYRCAIAGKRVSILTDLILYHDSHVGKFNAKKISEWEANQRSFCTKFNMSQNWHNDMKHVVEFLPELPRKATQSCRSEIHVVTATARSFGFSSAAPLGDETNVDYWRTPLMSANGDSCWAHLVIEPREAGHVHTATVRSGKSADSEPVSVHHVRLVSNFATGARVDRKEKSVADTSAATLAGPPALPSEFSAQSWFHVEVVQTPGAMVERFSCAIPTGVAQTNPSQPIHVMKELERLPTNVLALRYVASHDDLIRAFGTSVEAARTHYKTYGVPEGRGIFFDPLRYVASHPDLFSIGLDEEAACVHYITKGHAQGLALYFDPFVYVAGYEDLVRDIGADARGAALHFMQTGFAQGRNCDSFDWRAYLDQNPGIPFHNRTPSGAALHFINSQRRA